MRNPAAERRTTLPRPGMSDVWGGVAAMLVAVPSSIAYGVIIFTAVSPSLASTGALAGILGAALLGLVAPLVGRNGGLITAPCAPAAAVLAGFALELRSAQLTPARILVLLALTALVSAGMQVVFGLVRAGRLIKYIPYPVVTGYLSGVAVIIAMAQLPKLLGAPGGTGIGEALVSPQLWRWPGIAVGLVTIIVMVVAPRWIKAVPPAILGLGAGIATYFAIASTHPSLMRLSGNPLVVGPIGTEESLWAALLDRSSALLALRPADFAIVAGAALTLAALLSIDTLKTGVVLDAMTGRRLNSNRELVAQGIANLASAAGGGVPGAGTMGPTLVNVTSGGNTPWSGVVEGMLAFLTLIALGRLVGWVPIAALAGILLVIAWRMFDVKMFRLLLLPSTRLDFTVIAAVVIVAASVGLIEASAVGVGLAILLFIRNQIRGTVIIRKIGLDELRSKRRRSADASAILDERGSEGLLVQLKEDLFFGTTDQLFTDLEADLGTRRFILFDFRRVHSIDYTAGQLFMQMQARLRRRGGQLLFSGLPSGQAMESYMRSLGLFEEDTGVRTFEIRDSALQWMEERILEGAGWSAGESAPPLAIADIAVFHQLEAQTLDAVSRALVTRSLRKGELAFQAGDPGEEIFFVRSGRIDILLPLAGGKRHHLATVGRGDFFGEMAFLDHGQRSAEAVAATPVELFVLGRAALEALVRADALLAHRIYEQLALALAQRLRVTDAELRALEER